MEYSEALLLGSILVHIFILQFLSFQEHLKYVKVKNLALQNK